MRVAIEVDIPSDVRYIEHIVRLVTRECEDQRFSPRLCSLNVPVALTEALSNAILRGNADDRQKHVRVRIAFTERELIVEVTDEGGGFDLADKLRDPTTPENILREDGRGLFLMHRLMDRVERFTDQGNVVRLTLHRA